MKQSALVLVLLGMLACSSSTSKKAEAENVALGGDIAAKVGGRPIEVSLVAAVAAAQGVTARDAVQRVIDDEIAAGEARSRGLDQRPPTSWLLVAARARLTTERLNAEARRRGPPTAEEITMLSERHWGEVDRPPTVHVVHAIVLLPKVDSAKAQAKALASDLRAEVVGATNQAEFEARGKAFAKAHTAGPIEVRVEDLPPFTQDGRIPPGKGRMDDVFVKAAYALANIGDTSSVIETSFGWHVIRLLERFPEKRMPMEMRGEAFAEEAYAIRGRELADGVLKRLREANPIAISPTAEGLMRDMAASMSSGGSKP